MLEGVWSKKNFSAWWETQKICGCLCCIEKVEHFCSCRFGLTYRANWPETTTVMWSCLFHCAQKRNAVENCPYSNRIMVSFALWKFYRKLKGSVTEHVNFEVNTCRNEVYREVSSLPEFHVVFSEQFLSHKKVLHRSEPDKKVPLHVY